MTNEILNRLNITIHAYLKPDNGKIRGAGPRVRGKHRSEIPPGQDMPLDLKGVKEGFALIYKFDEMPEKDGVKGVKVMPGLSEKIHHFEFYETDENKGKYLAVVHYEGPAGVESSPFGTHEDPEVVHPNPPNP